MYDSIAYIDDAWTVLMADVDGRPAVVETRIGAGRALVIVPTFERYVTGALSGSEDIVAASRRLLTNLLTYRP